MPVSINMPGRAPSGIEGIANAVGIVDKIGAMRDRARKADEEKLAKDQSAKFDDPNSEESRQAREIYSSAIGSPISEAVSANRLKEVYGPVGNFVRDKMKSESALANSLKEIEARGKQERQNKLVAQKVEKPTSAQSTSALYAKRAQEADEALAGLTQSGFNASSAGNQAQMVAGELPLIGRAVEFFKGGDLKRYEQAQRNFVNAILRKESGAVISDAEFDSARKQYFPQPGDPPDVIAQKEQNRTTAIAALQSEAGPALERLNTTLASTPKRAGGGRPGPSRQANAAKVPEVKVVGDRVYIRTERGWEEQ